MRSARPGRGLDHNRGSRDQHGAVALEALDDFEGVQGVLGDQCPVGCRLTGQVGVFGEVQSVSPQTAQLQGRRPAGPVGLGIDTPRHSGHRNPGRPASAPHRGRRGPPGGRERRFSGSDDGYRRSLRQLAAHKGPKAVGRPWLAKGWVVSVSRLHPSPTPPAGASRTIRACIRQAPCSIDHDLAQRRAPTGPKQRVSSGVTVAAALMNGSPTTGKEKTETEKTFVGVMHHTRGNPFGAGILVSRCQDIVAARAWPVGMTSFWSAASCRRRRDPRALSIASSGCSATSSSLIPTWITPARCRF